MILTSRRQHRVLTKMHGTLRKSDPTLVAKFLIFSRLTCDEAIPAVERVRLKPLGPLVSAVRDATRRRRLTRPGRPRGPGRPRRWRLRQIAFIPAAVAALAAMALLLSHGQSAATCPPVGAAAHVSSGEMAGHRVGWPPPGKFTCLFP
jgi:hypothetical protein